MDMKSLKDTLTDLKVKSKSSPESTGLQEIKGELLRQVSGARIEGWVKMGFTKRF